MTLEEAVSLQDFISIYKKEFGQEPPDMGERGFAHDKIADIINAVKDKTPLPPSEIPEGADL